MPVTATRRIGIASQQNAALRNTALEQKKLQDASHTRMRNIAVGVITVGALATAAYLGRGYIFGQAQALPKINAKKICEDKFIANYTKNVGNPFGSEFSKAHSIFLNNSKALKTCLAQVKKDFCITNPTHRRCASTPPGR